MAGGDIPGWKKYFNWRGGQNVKATLISLFQGGKIAGVSFLNFHAMDSIIIIIIIIATWKKNTIRIGEKKILVQEDSSGFLLFSKRIIINFDRD